MRVRLVTRVLGLGQADGHAQYRGAKGLHHTAAVAIRPRQFTQEGTEPWGVTYASLGRHLGLGPATAVPTPPLMQDPVRHLHRNGRQFKHLMCVLRSEQGQCRVPTRTPLRPYLMYSRGRQLHLALAWMARLPTGFAWVRGVPMVARPLDGLRVRYLL